MRSFTTMLLCLMAAFGISLGKASSGQGIDEENTDLGGPKAPVDIDEAGGRRVRRYVSDYAKACNTYYGRRICYRIYETDISVAPEDFTCWKVGTTYGSYRKNCTETENLRFLADRGFYPCDGTD